MVKAWTERTGPDPFRQAMNLPNESEWDETTCNSIVCQHPQCWAALRRIERGHPRILHSSGRTPRDAEDKLPTLTIVNITDTCFWAKKRVAHPRSSEFTFCKERSLLSNLDLRCQGRSWKGLFDKGVINHTNRPPKLSVLNLNETKLPFSEDVGNMVVTWIPEGTEKTDSSVKKSRAFSSWPGKKRKKSAEKGKSSLHVSGKHYTETHSRSPGVIVPPPSPVHFFEPLTSESLPVWTQVDMLPQDLLKECILAHGGKSLPCPEVKIQLAKMRKNRPLEKDRPDSAISSKMYLTIHRLTLQRPSLRYPEHLRKPPRNLRRDSSAGAGSPGYQKKQQQQQQKKVKTPTKKQEAKKKAKSDPEAKPCLRTPSSEKGDKSQEQQEQQEEEKMKDTSKSVSIVESVDDYDDYSDSGYSISPESSEIYETDSTHKDITDLQEKMVGILASCQEKERKLSKSLNEIGWNPELKLLRILQAEEDEENRPSRAQSEVSLED